MPRTYAARTFLRQAPNELLKEYFTRKSIIRDVDFDLLGKTEVEPIMAAMETLPIAQRAGVEEDFRQINNLACEQGVRVLLEEAESIFHQLHLADMFARMRNHYERAFWMFLNHHEVFEIAADLAYMDGIGSWRTRKIKADLRPAVGTEDLSNLAKEISGFYRKQGRGHNCHVDNYLRQSPERHCYFAYAEDYGTTDLCFDDNGEFCHKPRKPAFEVIFVYKPATGVLETSASGRKDQIEKLESIFGRAILGLERLPAEQGPHYDLSPLKSKNINFRIDPRDGVEAVFVRMLRFDLHGMGNRRITFEASSNTDGKAIYKLIDSALEKRALPLASLTLAKAKLQMRFAARDRNKGKTLTFEISTPNRCTLKDDPLDQVAKRYIQKWGIEVG
jgi:hypothetical protein